MKRLGGLLAAGMLAVCPGLVRAAERPNIVLILADDIGFGDLGCHGATLVRTPHLDRLAGEGRRFTAAHSAAGTCTPSRRGLLTGVYSWRQQPGSGIARGDVPLCIAPRSTTLPSMLKRAGYRTGLFGNWHLGLPTLVGVALGTHERADSLNVLPTLLGPASTRSPRTTFIAQRSGVAGPFAVIQDNWKYIEAARTAYGRENTGPLPAEPEPQLYHLARDPAEALNLAREHPEVVARLTQALVEASARKADGAAPGPPARK
jgi:arylsulfatase A-like enzyme